MYRRTTMKHQLTQQHLQEFADYLKNCEKQPQTISKYVRDCTMLLQYLGEKALDKIALLEYRDHLKTQNYKVASINASVSSINTLVDFLGWGECRIKRLTVQSKNYNNQEELLTRDEYIRLLRAAKGRPRMLLMLQTICSTGIRVSELQYFTLQSAFSGKVVVTNKNKTRTILLPDALRKRLYNYCKQNKIYGNVFVSRYGKPLDRCNIWRGMKGLAKRAKVNPVKVYPHNLRKLFARSYYAIDRDIATLADILGHSNINTTRIYIRNTDREHLRKINKMKLVMKSKDL